MTLFWRSTLVTWEQGSGRVREEMKAPLFHLRDPLAAWEPRRQALFCWTFLLQEASHEFSIAEYLSVFCSVYHHISESAELTQAKGMIERGQCFWNKTYLKEWTDDFLLISPEKHLEIHVKRVKLAQVSASDPIHFFPTRWYGRIRMFVGEWDQARQQGAESMNWRLC